MKAGVRRVLMGASVMMGYARTVSIFRAWEMASSWVRACRPVPMMPTVLASARASRRVARPLAAPVRICDTRSGNPSSLSGGDNQCDARTVASGQVLTINVAGLAGVPSDSSAVVINLTAVNSSTTTFLTVFPGPTQPFSSDLDPTRNSVQANLFQFGASTKGERGNGLPVEGQLDRLGRAHAGVLQAHAKTSTMVPRGTS